MQHKVCVKSGTKKSLPKSNAQRAGPRLLLVETGQDSRLRPSNLRV